jgi:hypothetical protein
MLWTSCGAVGPFSVMPTAKKTLESVGADRGGALSRTVTVWPGSAI